MEPDFTRFPAGKPAEIERMAADVKAIFLEVLKKICSLTVLKATARTLIRLPYNFHQLTFLFGFGTGFARNSCS
jgi:hypothetical protein